MTHLRSQQKYVLATLAGAMIGGVIVALATKAIPRIMSEMMARMMKNMMQKREGRDGFPEI